jgi:hypothetical protein
MVGEATILKYRPTGTGTPTPELLTQATVAPFCGRWIPVTEALPPARLNVIVIVRGDNCPAYAWLKFAAGDKLCPYFVVPQRGAMEDRGAHIGKPLHAQHREDVTHWFSPSPSGLPLKPKGFEDAAWGLGGCGWETKDSPLNPKRFYGTPAS